MTIRIRRLEAGSMVTGELAKGCIQCEEGAKLVLLITGLCGRSCWYCPLSDEKYKKDVIYANERLVNSIEEVIAEGEAMDALGTGITGGDPLDVTDRTVDHIIALKKHFGKEHHIHLYTPTYDDDKISRIIDAGLDELRFHPPPSLWNEKGLEPYIDIIKRYGKRIDVGFEIPAVPQMTAELITLCKVAQSAGAAFVNLNELEYSPTNFDNMQDHGITPMDEFCTSAIGSSATAFEVLTYEFEMPVHFCSSPFKDSIQMRKRLIRRGENIAQEYEVLTEDGTFIIGIVELSEEELGSFEQIMESKEVPRDMWSYSPLMGRVETAPWILEELASSMIWPCFIIEVYASHDRLEVEREPLEKV